MKITISKAINYKNFKTILELNKNIEEYQKQIDDLNQIKCLLNEQNYDLMVELKNKT